jgi:hypothetical protein
MNRSAEELLKHLSVQKEVREGYSLRAFNALRQNDRAENNWNMQDLVWPDWIESVHNIVDGGRTFIFGTGPSLIQQQPLLHHMQNETTWTVNRMRRWYEKGQLPFIPDHHVVCEPGPCILWGTMILKPYDFPEAKNRIAVNWWNVTATNWLWCPKAPDDIQMRWQGFQGLGDTLAPLTTGWASPLTVSQLACWMGYDEIYYLGIDTTQEGQAWDPVDGRTLYARNIRSICESFDRARIDIQRAGRKVYDCTPGGRINQEGILEYVPLEDALQIGQKINEPYRTTNNGNHIHHG